MAGTTITSSSFCNDNAQGTGQLVCDLGSFGTPRGGGLANKGTLIDITTISDVIVTNLIKGRKLHNFPKMFDFKQTSDKNGTAKSSTNIEVLTLLGLVMIDMDWVNNPCLHKSLYNMQGQDKYDLVLYFDKGVLFWRNFDGTMLKGADAGMFSVSPMELQNGTNPQKSTASIQLKDANEFNTLFVFKTWEDLGFNLLEKKGVIDTIVTVIGTPTSTSTSLNVKLTSSCGGDIITGLDDETQWILGGVQTTPRTISAVSVNASTGVYTLTLSGALGTTATFAPTLSDGIYNVATDAIGQLFAGKATLGTV